MRLLFVLITAFCFQQIANAQQLSSSQMMEIEEYVESLISQEDPGLAYGVVKNGEIVLEGYRGIASLQHNAAISELSKFNIASVAKQFTALAVLDLSLKGKLKLDDDIRIYLPEFYSNLDESILIRQLLNHSSGIRDFYDLMSLQSEPWWRQEGLDNDDALELLTHQKDLNFKPGSEYLYSNSNYTILTKLVEVVSGMSFHEYTRALFDRLDMPNTEFNKNYMLVIENIAFPYADWGDGVWQQYPHMTNLFGDGFLYTTLKDQLNFEVAVQKAAESNNQLLIQSQLPVEGATIDEYGFGLELTDRLGLPSVHHSGGTGAYHAQTVRFPDEELSIIVMSNNSTLWSGFIADKISSVILADVENEKIISNNLDANNYKHSMANSDLIGEYKTPEGAVIRVSSQEGILVWRNANNNPIELKNELGSLFTFARNTDVKVGFDDRSFTVYYPGEEPRIHKKLEAFEPTKNYMQNLSGRYYNEETEVTFELSMSKEGKLVLHNSSNERLNEIEIIQRDELLINDYIIRPVRNKVGVVDELILTFSRLKNVRFVKISSGDAQMLQYTSDGGTIKVSTTSRIERNGNSDIKLTKYDSNGLVEWSKYYGGDSYEFAGSVVLTSDGGFLITGSTSSFGNGNYDVWIVKVDSTGNQEWATTYGELGNEYGLQAKEADGRVFKILASSEKDYNPTSFSQVISISENGEILE